jgi:hypothetical protein
MLARPAGREAFLTLKNVHHRPRNRLLLISRKSLRAYPVLYLLNPRDAQRDKSNVL